MERDDEIPIEHEGGSTSLSESLSESSSADSAPADPDLIVVRDAAEEFGLTAKPEGEPEVADADLVIDRTGFNSPEVKPGENPYRVQGPVRPPPPKRIAVEAPPPEPDLDAIYGASEPAKDTKKSINWDEAFLTPAPSKKRPPSGAFPAPPMPSAGSARAPSHAPAAAEPKTKKRPERRVVVARRVTPPSVVKSGLAALGAVAVFGVATALMTMRLEPFFSWYYLLAWYPLLLVLNWAAAVKNAKLSLFEGRARDVAYLLAWSAPVWLFFELWNFRVQNWYYIGVPDVLPMRWAGILLSFATVLPGIFFFEEVLAVRGAFSRTRRAPLAVGDGLLRACTLAGLLLGLAILALPDFFFAFVWAVPTLLIEPWLFRRDHPSLLQDLAEGRPGRILRLMAAGMCCGLFWEAANFLPGGKWIYTVPWVGSWKVFEMPVLGFIGFAPFGLACWSMARALVEARVLPEWIVSRKPVTKKPAAESEAESVVDEIAASADEEAPGTRRPLSPAWLKLALGAAALACAFVLAAMDRWTIDSMTARPENIPAIPDGIAEYAHKRGSHDVQGLLNMINAGSLYMPGESSARVLHSLAERCRIVMLRGIGTQNAMRLYRVGVSSREELAARDPDELSGALAALGDPGWSPKPRRVQVWVEAARKDLAAAGR